MFKLHKIADHLARLNESEVEEVIKTLEELYPNSAFVNWIPRPPGESNYTSDSLFVRIVLKSYGDYKLQILKIVKEEFAMPLFEAKKLVDNAPSFLGSGVYTSSYGEHIKKLLESHGAIVELKPE